MSQVDQRATVSVRSLIVASQILESLSSAVVQEDDCHTVSITETDRINALHKIINLRKLREATFPSVSFSDPFWDIILTLSYDLKISRTTFVKSVCIDSGLPTATALRYLDILAKSGIVYRSGDPKDGRRSVVSLTEESSNSIDTLLNAWIQDVALMKLSELDIKFVDHFKTP